MSDSLRELREALLGRAEVSAELDMARLDLHREARTGVPEIVQAAGKALPEVLEIVRTLVRETGRAILSRVEPEMAAQIEAQCMDCRVSHHIRASMMVVEALDAARSWSGGRVGIICAGTSDAPYAEQARVMVEAMGCQALMIYDVGVAGLHRLLLPLQSLMDREVASIVVVAGMDGALPSVVAGLVDVPVIGLPTSTGYGFGGRGEAALMSMLQTCVPGLTVVNIDNGVGAGASAARIANRIAAAQLRHPVSA